MRDATARAGMPRPGERSDPAPGAFSLMPPPPPGTRSRFFVSLLVLALPVLLAGGCAGLSRVSPAGSPEAPPASSAASAPTASAPLSPEERERVIARSIELVLEAREQARLGLVEEAEATWKRVFDLVAPLAARDEEMSRRLRALRIERDRSLAEAEALAELGTGAGVSEESQEILEGPEPSLDTGRVEEVGEAAAGVEADYPIVRNRQVLAWIEQYQGPWRSFLAGSMRRSGRWIERFREIFAEEGVPRDLVYMAHVESGFKTSAYSRARARGIFQFIASTARRYGLVVDWWVDERADPEKSCRAAAAYLRDLYDEFGDWYLALAAYNAGEGRVRRAIRRAHSRDFWVLSRRRLLRRETRNYVPAILAATLISKDPASFGFGDVVPEPPERYELVTVPTPTDLEILARCARTDVATLRRLNPAIRRHQTPPHWPDFPLKVPVGHARGFAEALAKIPPEKRIVRIEYRVRRGDTLSRIARRHGTTVRAIQQANRMGRRTLLHPGQVLVIPRGPAPPPPRRPARLDPDGTTVVRRGDTLSRIARRFGVTVRDLQRWNGLGRSTRIVAGQRLRVRPPGKEGKAVRRAAAPRSSRRPGRGGRVHVVRRGDTLWGIARRYGVTLADLRAANGFRRRNPLLRPGQRIRIPAVPRQAARRGASSTRDAAGRRVHVVRRGETLSRIARRYGLTVRQLCELNGIDPDTVIHPGDRLAVAR